MVVAVKSLACELPSRLCVPLSRLYVPDIPAEVIERGIAEISGATIWRWLSEDAIKPWRHRSWIFPHDPDFEAKAARVLDLTRGSGRQSRSADRPRRLFDEKTSIRPASAAMKVSGRRHGGRHASSTSTTGEVPFSTSPPGTSIAPRCSGAASPPPVSSLSVGLSNK